jgi:hydrogenase maturation protease
MVVNALDSHTATEQRGTVDGVGESVLIAALGNPLRGDDGAGPAVIRALKNECSLPESVTYVEFTGSALLSVLIDARYDRVIIVDAANIHRQPGDWARFDINDVQFTTLDLEESISLHNLNLPETLVIMDTLGVPIPEVIIYGIQPQDVGYADELSEAVQAVIHLLSKTIRDEVLAFTEV